jgi:nucleoside-diphosphate-sugar epimerase
MKLLVLGGTSFVGPAVVEAALARGWDVTCVHRGSRPSPRGARAVLGDRTDREVLALLAAERFDAAVDTWSLAPWVVRDTARALSGAVERWAYVSTRSVYDDPPLGADESAAVVSGDPDGDATDYPHDKRGAEVAYEREVGADRVVHLRAGLILGPRENIGRLPWWLRRVAYGGPFLAPGPPDLPLQYVDARDLAEFALDCVWDGRSGPVDTVSPAGHTTMRDLLRACVEVTGSDASPVWVDAAWLLERGIEPWTELPVWIPREHEAYAMHAADTARAYAWGLRCRPVRLTVADTWAWLQDVRAGRAPAPPPRDGIGLDEGDEAALLAQWRTVAVLRPGSR